jgi:hypothetical protein
MLNELRPSRIELLHARHTSRQFLHEPIFEGSTPVAVLVLLLIVLLAAVR